MWSTALMPTTVENAWPTCQISAGLRQDGRAAAGAGSFTWNHWKQGKPSVNGWKCWIWWIWNDMTDMIWTDINSYEWMWMNMIWHDIKWHEMKWQWYCIFNIDILWYGTIWYYMRSCYDMIQKILTCMYLYKQHIIHVHEIWKMINFMLYVIRDTLHMCCMIWHYMISTYDNVWYDQHQSTKINNYSGSDQQNNRLSESQTMAIMGLVKPAHFRF